jgi:hypothetical protein
VAGVAGLAGEELAGEEAELAGLPDAVTGSAVGGAEDELDEPPHAATSTAAQASAAPPTTSRAPGIRRARIINSFPFHPIRHREPGHRI